MRYEVITPLLRAGKRVEPGTAIDMDEGEAQAKVRCGALRPLPATKAKAETAPPAPPTKTEGKGKGKGATPPPATDPKSLADQSLEELKATAAAEEVPDVAEVDDEAKLREAIETHRTSKQAS